MKYPQCVKCGHALRATKCLSTAQRAYGEIIIKLGADNAVPFTLVAIVSDPQRQLQLPVIKLLNQALYADPDNRRFADAPFFGGGKRLPERLAEIHG